MKTLPKKTYQVWAMESRDTATDTVTQLCTNSICAEYVHKIKMAYNRKEVQWAWLLVVFYNDFFCERHCAGQKEADLCRNDNKHSSPF